MEHLFLKLLSELFLYAVGALVLEYMARRSWGRKRKRKWSQWVLTGTLRLMSLWCTGTILWHVTTEFMKL